MRRVSSKWLPWVGRVGGEGAVRSMSCEWKHQRVPWRRQHGSSARGDFTTVAYQRSSTSAVPANGGRLGSCQASGVPTQCSLDRFRCIASIVFRSRTPRRFKGQKPASHSLFLPKRCPDIGRTLLVWVWYLISIGIGLSSFDAALGPRPVVHVFFPHGGGSPLPPPPLDPPGANSRQHWALIWFALQLQCSKAKQ